MLSSIGSSDVPVLRRNERRRAVGRANAAPFPRRKAALGKAVRGGGHVRLCKRPTGISQGFAAWRADLTEAPGREVGVLARRSWRQSAVGTAVGSGRPLQSMTEQNQEAYYDR